MSHSSSTVYVYISEAVLTFWICHVVFFYEKFSNISFMKMVLFFYEKMWSRKTCLVALKKNQLKLKCNDYESDFHAKWLKISQSHIDYLMEQKLN